MEETLVLLKPDALERRLVGTIIARFERKSFQLLAMKQMQFTPELARQHYSQLTDRPYYCEIEAYITRGPIIALILRGNSAISAVRSMIGPTDGCEAPAGTIRGDFCLSYRENLVHASDSPDAASREIALFFPS